MRRVPQALQNRLQKNIQVPATDAEPSLELWITRPTVPLTQSQFLERELILVGDGALSDTDIAVSRPKAGREADRLWAAYIDDGVARIVYADAVTAIEQHTWIRHAWSAEAESVAIAFDGTMVNTSDTEVEFITQPKPWVFWIHEGALYAYYLDSGIVWTLAASNASSVTVIRATSSNTKDFDYGLVAFFLLNGSIYYRQLIGEEWYDAEPVLLGPEDILFTKISAFRTWDYRIGLQALAEDGTLYELFTQYQGFAKRGQEHAVRVTDAVYEVETTEVNYLYAKSGDETIGIPQAENTSPYGGCYLLGNGQIIGARNIPTQVIDEETQFPVNNWGLRVQVFFDREINHEQVTAQISCFTMTDGAGRTFYPSDAIPDSTGRVFTFTFRNFNNAHGELTVSYESGTVETMGDGILQSGTATFTPENLVPYYVPRPVPVALWNE